MTGCTPSLTRPEAANPTLAAPGLEDFVSAMSAGDGQRALEIADEVFKRDPDSVDAAFVVDGANDLLGARVFPPAVIDCDDGALEVYRSAEYAFSDGRHLDAADLYDRALKACPSAAGWWVYAGDNLFQAGEFARARAHYERALAIDPWRRDAHRFLVDDARVAGDEQQAFHLAVQAVISDPTYEMGWQYVKQTAEALGRRYLRVLDRKPVYSVGDDGRPNVTVRTFRDGLANMKAWFTYGAARTSWAAAAEPQLVPDRTTADAMARERYQVTKALKAYSEAILERPHERAPFWEGLLRARAADALDEAIYMHLLDDALVPAFVEFREHHADRLVAYVETLLVPKPSAKTVPGQGPLT